MQSRLGMSERGRAMVVVAGVAALGVVAMLASPAALAEPVVVEETPAGAKPVEELKGSILIGALTEGVVSDIVVGCDPMSAANGIEATFFDVSKHAGHYAELTPAATLDASAYFYAEDCALLERHDEAAENPYDDAFFDVGPGTVERGYIPSEAAFVQVSGFIGTGDFTLTVFDVTR